jgi:hypothetical protein
MKTSATAQMRLWLAMEARMVANLACSGNAARLHFCRQSWVRVTSTFIDPQWTRGTLLSHHRPLAYVSFLHGSP